MPLPRSERASMPAAHCYSPVLQHALSASCLVHEPVCELALELSELTARRRIAADIHDGVPQTLVSARMRLDQVLDERGHGVDTRYQLVLIQQTLDYAVRDLRAPIESLSGQRTSRLDMVGVLGMPLRPLLLRLPSPCMPTACSPARSRIRPSGSSRRR